MNALNPTRAGLLETFALDTVMVQGRGCHLYDAQGREYLDFLAQYGALPFGHNPPSVWAALDQARLNLTPSMVQPLRATEAERLAQRLAEVTPGDLGIVTLANSGAEAVEAAIKLARVRTGRDVILSTLNSFHGKTLGALSATGKPMYQRDFAAPAPAFDYVPYGDLTALEARLAADADRIAAFIVEPIQGEGGVVVPPEGYLDGVIALCRRYGVLSVIDEIQTGLGRTGKLFACADCAEAPDMLLLAKALGGGMMPIAACIARPSAWDDRFGRLHSSTFANNNLACTVANATLDALLDDDGALVRGVAEHGAYFRDRLLALQAQFPEVIRDVRGRGYMMGLEFHRLDTRRDSATMAYASLNGGLTPLISSYLMNIRGLVTAPLFNESHVMRLQPPLTVGRAEIDRAMDALTEVCGIIDRRDYHALVRHLVTPERAAKLSALPVPAEIEPSRGAEPAEPGRFAFLIHFTEEADVFRSDPSFRKFDEAELSAWLSLVKRFGPGVARRLATVTSKTGATAQGMIMSVPMLPTDMRGKGKALATGMIRGAVEMAAHGGVSRLGLGAFTSIVTRGGAAVTGHGVPITSGNTLTTVSAIKSIEGVAARVGLSLQDARVAVVGASGAIGRLASLMLARRVGSLSLVGNGANAFAPSLLARVADDVVAALLDDTALAGIDPGALARHLHASSLGRTMHEGDDTKGLYARFATEMAVRGAPTPLTCTTDLASALDDADIVLVATSSELALIDPSRLRPGTLVCDVARPPNVAQADLSDSGVLVFDGGLVRPPSPVDLGPFQTLPTDLCWGCLGETMLLALAGQQRDFSIGSRLSLADADLVAALAEEHGFEPAEIQWYGSRVDDVAFDRFADHVHAAHLHRVRTSSRLPCYAINVAAE